ncbi:MAG: sensor histidine kinase [Nitrososphaera sp.]
MFPSTLLPKVQAMGIIAVILVSAFSFALFFYLQELTREEIRTTLFEQHRDAQIEATRRISEHIGTDLDLIAKTIEGLANSYYLQQGDLSSRNAKSLIEEQYEELSPRISSLLILDKDNIVAVSIAPRAEGTFLSSDFSQRQWVIDTRASGKPLYSDGFERQGIYRIFISYPIVSKETQEILGIIAVSIPTVPYFAYYANVHDVNTQFLVAFNREGTLLAVGASQELVGDSFFGEETQNFINHNPVLNNLTRSLLEGNSGHGLYDYGTGERFTTQSPVFVGGLPIYFIQLVTPSAEIYSEVDAALQEESGKLFLLLSSALISIGVLTLFLLKWNRVLGNEVRTRTEQLTDANERLEINLKAQKEFLEVAAHEIRTPVQPILGIAEVLHAGTAESASSGTRTSVANSRERQLLDVIIRNAQRLKKLTENLLDVSRIDSQTLRLSNEKFDLSRVAASTVQDFKNGLDMNVKIDIVFTPCENAIVNADKERVIQVISNLLNNSQKFVKEGTIQVGIKRVDSQVMVTVRDDGEGIHPDVLPVLFTKFVSRSDGGTGLGLYISKGIVEAQGGRIWAENNDEGTGASFHFVLPLAS